VALYGYLASGNIGNDASFETVLEWLRTEHPDVGVRCITLTPQAVQARYGITSVPFTVPPRDGRGRAGSAAAKLMARLADVPRSLAAAGSVDAVIVPGMGVLEESLGVRPWGFPSWLILQAAACRLRRRPFALLAVGAEPIGNPVSRRLFTATVDLATHVSYRDTFSAGAMRDAGARRTGAVAADLAFAHPASRHADPEPGRVVVGVLSYYGPSNGAVRGAAIRRRYVQSLADAVTRLADSGDRIVLVGGDGVDTAAAEEILAETRALRPDLPEDAVTVRDVTSFAELSREMARAEAVVASRYHNLICALRLGRPTVSVGYAAKSARLMGSLGLADYHQHIDELDAGKLIAQLRAVRDQAPDLAKQLGAACDGFDDEVRALLDSAGAGLLGRHRASRGQRGRAR
jgi:polysaccharide pyruvyl transferase WcaK-like protein